MSLHPNDGRFSNEGGSFTNLAAVQEIVDEEENESISSSNVDSSSTPNMVSFNGKLAKNSRIPESHGSDIDVEISSTGEDGVRPSRALRMRQSRADKSFSRRGTMGLRRPSMWGTYKRRSTMKKHSIWTIDYDEEDAERELILKIRKNLPLKDFTEEVRAHKDLAKFLLQPTVLLDLPDTDLETIIEKMMEKLRKDVAGEDKIYVRADKAFFTNHPTATDSMASSDTLRETIQGVKYLKEGTTYEETWLTTLCILPMLKKSHVVIARLRHPLNLGNKFTEVSFVIAVVAPEREKFTKNAVEVGRTFSSLMTNIYFRRSLSNASTEDEFKQVLIKQHESFRAENGLSLLTNSFEEAGGKDPYDEMEEYPFYHFGRGAIDDIRRRLPYYPSDFIDGFVGKNTLRKVIATTFFLYFSCLLPDIAFGALYEKNTNGKIGVASCILAQTFGGLVFSLISGQPLLVLITTAPLALYVKVIYMVSDVISVDFLALYAMVGLWNSFFIFLQGCFHASKLMRYSTRSTEEIFAFFVGLAFIADAVLSTMENHEKNYNFNSTKYELNSSTAKPLPDNCLNEYYCVRPENFVLFLFLMFGTLSLAMIILRFEQSQFLSSTKREILADFALPISVIIFSVIGSIAFRDINLAPFNFVPEQIKLELAPFHKLRFDAVLVAAGLGLSLSCLFYVDDNVTAELVNTPSNKLQKGSSCHWDLIVVALINAILSIFNLPWLHSALPHSPMHVRALADVEKHVTNLGTVEDEIVKVRETRITTLVSHIFIGLSLLFVHVLQYIPVAVFQGLFLYLGLMSFVGNQLFDRMLLFFTEGSSYPPNHYVRKVPQRKLHLFTICQLVQLAVVCVFGFSKQFYLKMIFPVIILLLLPIRHKVLPLFIETRYLCILDSYLT
uniref:sodium bicarbonate transporter-like protein 11 isoform X1 n=1 Tax=Styela clava TaxID=7725 RepID=UPI001939A07D|nr:sodium bicarbonate transporter-like protein 11 isoform X1 [Styela clava]